MTTHLLCAAVLLVVTAVSSEAAQRRPTMILVFVKGPAAQDGFTDVTTDRADSTKDITKYVASELRKWVRPAPDEARAHIVLDVVERHMEDNSEVHAVTVRVVVGAVERTVTGRSDSNWRDAARNLVAQIDTWANENRERILAARDAR